MIHDGFRSEDRNILSIDGDSEARGNESFRSRLGLMIACFFFAFSYMDFVSFLPWYIIYTYLLFSILLVLLEY